MSKNGSSRVGDFGAMVRLVQSLPAPEGNATQVRRRLLADLCRLMGQQFGAPATRVPAGLPRRHAQTLERLLAGDSEKQIALHLKLSQHTVHVYVKALYKRYGVNSRGELLARFLARDPAPDRMASPV